MQPRISLSRGLSDAYQLPALSGEILQFNLSLLDLILVVLSALATSFQLFLCLLHILRNDTGIVCVPTDTNGAIGHVEQCLPIEPCAYQSGFDKIAKAHPYFQEDQSCP